MKEYLFGFCRDGHHSECPVEFKEWPLQGGVTLEAWRCICDCGHTAQKELEMTTTTPRERWEQRNDE